MTCAHCEELEERVAWLESELTEQRSHDDYARLHRALRNSAPNYTSGSGGTTRALLALYSARGKPVSRLGLMDASPPAHGGEDERSWKLVDVWVCFGRKLVGRGGIEAVRDHGYRLTDEGMAKIAAILAPAERRAA